MLGPHAGTHDKGGDDAYLTSPPCAPEPACPGISGTPQRQQYTVAVKESKVVTRHHGLGRTLTAFGP